MVHKYFKPLKKFVSRKMALEKLRLKSKQFDRLCILCAIYPVVPNLRNCIDQEKGWYYKIEDVRSIYYSDAYDVLCKNRNIEKRKEEYLKFDRIEKLKNIKEEDYGLVGLVKSKYSSFGSSIADLGETLRHLYFIDMLKIHDVKDALCEFENFILKRKLLDKVFMSKKGIFYSFDVEKIKVMWQVPYPSLNLDQIVEEKKDIEINLKANSMPFLDFGSEIEDEESSDTIVDTNDPNKLDISLIKYSAPLMAIHLKLSLHKYNLLYKDVKSNRKGIFQHKKVCVCVDSIKTQIEFILKHEDALIVSLDESEIVIAETVDIINPGILYIQPQFVFDSLNSGYLLDYEPYYVGKTLPIHKSPFPDILTALDERVLKTLSNTRKYKILDKVIKLD